MTTTKQSGGLPERHKAHLSRPPITRRRKDESKMPLTEDETEILTNKPATSTS